MTLPMFDPARLRELAKIHRMEEDRHRADAARHRDDYKMAGFASLGDDAANACSETAAALEFLAGARVETPENCAYCSFCVTGPCGDPECRGAPKAMTLTDVEADGKEPPSRCPLRTQAVIVTLGVP